MGKEIIPDFQRGQRLSAAELNRIVRAVRQQIKGVAPGIRVDYTGSEILIKADFSSVTTDGMFAVRVWQDGGSTDGDEDTKCNRTYQVRTLPATAISTGGEELGSAMTPLKRRPAFGPLDVPSDLSDGEIGTGFYDEDDVFFLYDANETLDVDAC
ncbi:hypothetical protein LCGC14_0235710 [marine sediment metagenome]|uniref:Uncharacterized protein n=1 Tax=marine sediment metagenome TaxID=412755 RepID=A0A0F9U915_9ZZZZ